MTIKIKPGMKFQHNDYAEVLKGNKFEVISCDYYGDGEEILCAATDKEISPLDEILLSYYMPMVDGVWINEQNEYEY